MSRNHIKKKSSELKDAKYARVGGKKSRGGNKKLETKRRGHPKNQHGFSFNLGQYPETNVKPKCLRFHIFAFLPKEE